MSKLFVLYPLYVAYTPAWYAYGSMSDGINTNVL